MKHKVGFIVADDIKFPQKRPLLVK